MPGAPRMLATCALGADASLLIAVGAIIPRSACAPHSGRSAGRRNSARSGSISRDGFLRAWVERWALNAQNVYVAAMINEQTAFHRDGQTPTA